MPITKKKINIYYCKYCQKLYTETEIKYNRIIKGKGICINCFIKYKEENYLIFWDKI